MFKGTPQELVLALIGAGDSQSDIERETGISQASLSRIAAGLQSDPRGSTLKKLHEYATRRLRRKEKKTA